MCAAAAALRRAGRVTLSLPRRLSADTRSYGCAAAEVAYDSEWDDNYNGNERTYTAAPAVDTCGEKETRGVQWVFMGSVPPAQRRFFAARVAELLDVPYISMGTLVRQELHPRSHLYKKIASAVDGGRLVPEDIIFGLLSKRLEDAYRTGETGFILDGIPRTRVQAEILDQLADIDLVVNFKCMGDYSMKKHIGNGICLHCGKHFSTSNPEATDRNPCLAARTRHSPLRYSHGIEDEQTNVDKFRLYAEQGKLLEDYYREQGKLLDFHVAGGPGETWQGLLAALHLQHINTAPSTPKLMV